MTLLSRLGYSPKKIADLKSPLLTEVSEITVVIPVKDNQSGIDRYLDILFKVCPPDKLPAHVIIVDNNSRVPLKLKRVYPIPVNVESCTKAGPASARNHGAALVKTAWIHFTDSDCIPTENLFTGFLTAQNSAVGYAGNVKALGADVYSRYYDSQEILIPPQVYSNADVPTPDYLITANCLVWKPAFDRVGGFNETISIAGGEDIDLGFKLREIGELAYAFESISMHDFECSLSDFKTRFRRYGKGNKHVAEIYRLNLQPSVFMPIRKSVFNYFLAFVQFLSLRKGYRL